MNGANLCLDRDRDDPDPDPDTDPDTDTDTDPDPDTEPDPEPNPDTDPDTVTREEEVEAEGDRGEDAELRDQPEHPLAGNAVAATVAGGKFYRDSPPLQLHPHPTPPPPLPPPPPPPHPPHTPTHTHARTPSARPHAPLQLDEPLLCSSVPTSASGVHLICEDMRGDGAWCKSVDFIVDAGERPVEGSTIFDLTDGVELVRSGMGSADILD